MAHDGGRIDHGSFVGRAGREGIIRPERSIQVCIRTHAPTLGVQGIITSLAGAAVLQHYLGLLAARMIRRAS